MLEFFPSREVAVSIFGFGIHWYGLLYFAAFLIGWWMLPRIQRYRDISLTYDEWSTIISWAVVGVIVGGRLGFVFLYEPLYFIAHPLDIFAVWKGGMSSHGGFIGVTLAMFWALRTRKSDVLRIADIIVIPVAIGLALGRIGNFINLELYGTVTSLPWGIDIPGVNGARHPTQLYAVAKDLFIAACCFWHLKKQPYVAGHTLALFLILYGTLRFLLEYFRDQQGVFIGPFSEGQLLTLPIMVVGIVLLRRK